MGTKPVAVTLVSEQDGINPLDGKVSWCAASVCRGPVQPDPLVVLVIPDSRAPVDVEGLGRVGPAWPVIVQVGGYTITEAI